MAMTPEFHLSIGVKSIEASVDFFVRVTPISYNGTWQDDAKTIERISVRECYVVESTGQFDATILLQPPKPADTCDWYRRGDVISFHQFAVTPELQGKEIGAKLLDFIERRAAEHAGQRSLWAGLDDRSSPTSSGLCIFRVAVDSCARPQSLW